MSLSDKIRALGYEAVAIAGPTASGKTGLSLSVCEALDGEIISCDSMQIYKGMDIGTAKATAEERARAVHHLIDVCELSQSYSVADYVKDATEAARDIIKRGHMPVFCGGTGLYLDGVMRGEYPETTETDREVRAQLDRYLLENGADALYDMLCKTDPEAAEKIHKNNTKRVIRALEMAKCTGRTKTELDRENSEYKGLKIFVVCLNFHNRDTLYSRIEKRVDQMISEGLEDEIASLLDDVGFQGNMTAIQAIGYKELFPYMRGEATLKECTDALKTATRRYAKRQLTWFSHRDYTHMLWADREDGELKSKEELCGELFAFFE